MAVSVSSQTAQNMKLRKYLEEKRLELTTLFNGTGPQSGQRSLIDVCK